MNPSPLERQSNDLTETEPTLTNPSNPIISKLLANLRSVYLGPDTTTELLLTALIAQGHILIEDTPGVGKTTLAQSLARSLECNFQRIQFTPDLLPSDLLGLSILNPETHQLDWKPGPVFTNILLADEINRTNPRTQAALLEAMGENQVSIEGQTRPLPNLFMVVATQNPLESHGTFPLPESQLDRFLFLLKLGYPSFEDERKMLDAQTNSHPLQSLTPIANSEQIQQLQTEARQVHIDSTLLDHLVRFAQLSRKRLHLGLSPRGTLALRRAAQALALVRGRKYVIPFDIRSLLIPVCAHRISMRNLNNDSKPEKILNDLYLEAKPPQ